MALHAQRESRYREQKPATTASSHKIPLPTLQVRVDHEPHGHAGRLLVGYGRTCETGCCCCCCFCPSAVSLPAPWDAPPSW